MADPRTQGAQVVLDPDGEVSQAARGLKTTFEENTLARDAGYIALGLNPVSPSAHLTDPPPTPPPAPEEPPA